MWKFNTQLFLSGVGGGGGGLWVDFCRFWGHNKPRSFITPGMFQGRAIVIWVGAASPCGLRRTGSRTGPLCPRFAMQGSAKRVEKW